MIVMELMTHRWWVSADTWRTWLCFIAIEWKFITVIRIFWVRFTLLYSLRNMYYIFNICAISFYEMMELWKCLMMKRQVIFNFRMVRMRNKNARYTEHSVIFVLRSEEQMWWIVIFMKVILNMIFYVQCVRKNYRHDISYVIVEWIFFLLFIYSYLTRFRDQRCFYK